MIKSSLKGNVKKGRCSRFGEEKRYVYTVDLKTEFFKKRQTDRIKL